MKRLRKKLQSESGASLLMALLLLLVCMMVAASILGAAASNAGKYRSNRVEQQKYLTLSSAINLIADELQKAEYRGKYTEYTWTVENKDADGHVISTDYFYHIKQETGLYSCNDLTNQIPLQNELNEIFSKKFEGEGYTKLSGLDIEEAKTRTLTVTLPDNLKGYPYDSGTGLENYKISAAVTVQVKLDHSNGNIILTAWLGTDTLAKAKDVMSAELAVVKIPKTDANGNPVMDADGNQVFINGIPQVTAPTGEGQDAWPSDATQTQIQTAPMKWELNWIRKGAV